MHLSRLLPLLMLLGWSASAEEAPAKGVAPERFDIPAENGAARMPLFISADWNKPLPLVTRAVLVFHGIGRDAPGYYAAGLKARDLARASADATLILTPQFLADIDVRHFHVPADVLFWGSNTWSDGEPAKGPAPIGAFAVVDAILARLADRARFPALAEVVLAGHSAGGQLIQRFAVVGNGEAKLTAAGVAVRYVVANPSSYVYFTPERPAPVAADCPRFDRWKFGFAGDLPAYVADSAESLEARYAARSVTYLLGTADNDPKLPVLDKSCMAEAQGPDHLSRGLAYFAVMQKRHPSALNQTMIQVPGVAHNAGKMFESSEGVAVLFRPGG